MRPVRMTMEATKKHQIHVWAPDIFRIKGGIQTYTAFLLEALGNISPRVDCQVFLKNDVNLSASKLNESIKKVYFTGLAPGRLRSGYFALQTLGRGGLARPELVISTHAHFAVLARYLKRTMGIPYWIVAHGVEVWDLKNGSLLSSLQEADLILSVSEYTRDRMMAQQPFERERMAILPNTMDTARFNIVAKPSRLLERYGLSADQPVILTVGRLEKSEGYKGYDTILNALPAIREAIPNVRYLIVGKGDDRTRIEKMISGMKLEDCAQLTGFVPDEELSDYYNLCDLFAMPSKCEGFGIVYLEAMACGKPVLAGNKDGSVDALRRGELGVLVDPDNVAQIAASIIGVLKKTLPHPLLYNPHLLRQKVIEAYGFDSFKLKVSNLWRKRRLIGSFS